MVKIYALLILKRKADQSKHPVILSGYVEGNNSWVSWFYKSQLLEFAEFISKILTEKTESGTRNKIAHGQFLCYVYLKNNISCVAITDNEYPSRVAFDCLNKLMDRLVSPSSSDMIDRATKDYQLNNVFLENVKKMVEEYREPSRVDKIIKIKKDVDETKEILNKSVDQILARGEKLDDLIQKTDLLSDESKTFYNVAYKHNSCCDIL
jgi:synaptobrevin homolog YKT6